MTKLSASFISLSRLLILSANIITTKSLSCAAQECEHCSGKVSDRKVAASMPVKGVKFLKKTLSVFLDTLEDVED